MGISGDDPPWDEAACVLMMIEASPVTKDGELIGYVGTQFIPIDQYDEKAATALLETLSSLPGLAQVRMAPPHGL